MVRTEWMRGKCWDMAIALHKMTKLPIMGLYDDSGDCHHAFVVTENGMGIDARGLQSMGALKKGCAGTEVRELSIREIEYKWVKRKLSSQEIRAAKAEIGRNTATRKAVQEILAAKAVKSAGIHQIP